MTQDEIMKLEAGQELDALVAEYVMGTPFVKPTNGRCCKTCGWEWNIEDRDCQCWYADSMVMAWKIVEKMRADGYDDYHECGEEGKPHTWWMFEKDDEHYYAEAETDALAICRAALLAKMV